MQIEPSGRFREFSEPDVVARVGPVQDIGGSVLDTVPIAPTQGASIAWQQRASVEHEPLPFSPCRWRVHTSDCALRRLLHRVVSSYQPPVC